MAKIKKKSLILPITRKKKINKYLIKTIQLLVHLFLFHWTTWKCLSCPFLLVYLFSFMKNWKSFDIRKEDGGRIVSSPFSLGIWQNNASRQVTPIPQGPEAISYITYEPFFTIFILVLLTNLYSQTFDLERIIFILITIAMRELY